MNRFIVQRRRFRGESWWVVWDLRDRECVCWARDRNRARRIAKALV